MLQGVAGVVLSVLEWAVFAATVYAFVHAAMQRPDAYTAADKLTKPVWLVILGVAGAAVLLLASDWAGASRRWPPGVYLVDVRPKLLEVQGKSR